MSRSVPARRSISPQCPSPSVSPLLLLSTSLSHGHSGSFASSGYHTHISLSIGLCIHTWGWKLGNCQVFSSAQSGHCLFDFTDHVSQFLVHHFAYNTYLRWIYYIYFAEDKSYNSTSPYDFTGRLLHSSVLGTSQQQKETPLQAYLQTQYTRNTHSISIRILLTLV